MRDNFLQLQTLATLVLSYQLLLSPNALITTEVEILSILGLLLLCGMLHVDGPSGSPHHRGLVPRHAGCLGHRDHLRP